MTDFTGGTWRSLVDGAEVSAIPDSGDLHAHYDWTQASGTSTVTDQTDSEFDLSGSYSGPTGSINGLQAGRFDGINDSLNVSFAALSQPNHVFAVVNWRSTSGSGYLFDSKNESNRHGIYSDSGTRMFFSGSTVAGSSISVDTPYLTNALFNSPNSVLRVNQSQDASGDTGSNSFDGLVLGSYYGEDDFYGQFDIGEMLIYEADKSSIQSDIEQYLIDKWGPF